MIRRVVACALALATTAACALADEPAHADSPRVLEALGPDAQDVLLEADRFEVMAIECERSPAPGEDALHGDPIVKRVEVAAREDRVRLLSRIYQGIDEGADPATCFLPHHAVRATRGQAVVELIICFQCNQMLALGAGVRARRLVVITDAARGELARLIGELEWQRRVAGKPLDAWWSRLATLAAMEGGPRLDPGDEEGLLAVAEAVGWAGPGTARRCAEALGGLGPAAAPALPILRRHVEADLDRPACREALRVIAAIGPAAEAAASAVLTRLREALAVEATAPERPHADLVVGAAILALGAIGPAAREALPHLEALAADPRRPEDVRRLADVAARRLAKD